MEGEDVLVPVASVEPDVVGEAAFFGEEASDLGADLAEVVGGDFEVELVEWPGGEDVVDEEDGPVEHARGVVVGVEFGGGDVGVAVACVGVERRGEADPVGVGCAVVDDEVLGGDAVPECVDPGFGSGCCAGVTPAPGELGRELRARRRP